jgi:catechol 2,3-dioxygenase-like lactoylglutathione lyase family enzyme
MVTANSAFNVLYTKDVLATKEFFENLNVEILESNYEKLVFALGGFDLHYILSSSEPFEEYKYTAGSSDYGQGTLFYFAVEDLEKFYDLVKKAGGRIKSQIKENHWGAKEFLFEDPNGYRFVAYS